MNSFMSTTLPRLCLLGVFSLYSDLGISHPVDIELNKRAYEELKLANESTLFHEKTSKIDKELQPQMRHIALIYRLSSVTFCKQSWIRETRQRLLSWPKLLTQS